MLFVYWLGADLGVLLLARESKRRELTVAERGFALRMALVIDLLPRMAFALMLPVGLALTASGGFETVPAWAHAAAWTVAIGWIAVLLAMARSNGTPLAASLNRVHLGIQGALLLVLGAVAILSLSTGTPFANAWLAAKLLLYAAIFALGLGIDAAFRPVGPAFQRIATQGSQDADEAVFARGVDVAIRYVLALYAALTVIALLGVTKPF